MQYTEVEFIIQPTTPYADVLAYELGEIGFESFEETETGLKAYVPTQAFSEADLKQVCENLQTECSIAFSYKDIAEENWNAVWESAYEPILIDDFCFVYAPFHQPNAQAAYNILIEPKMSFGTAHHATTANILSFLKTENVQDKKVLDMGCGTAVLAILAALRGASQVDAIDNDQWAFENAVENAERNGKQDTIRVELGDAALLAGRTYDVVIANINRNILLNDIRFYAPTLPLGGVLLLSGFYEHDIPAIAEEAQKYGFEMDTFKEKDQWVAVRFIKTKNH